jgi:hypothetical protein
MTARGHAIAEVLRSAFGALAELDKVAPADVDTIVTMTVAHLRAWRPEAVSPLGTLPTPTDSIADPRRGP